MAPRIPQRPPDRPPFTIKGDLCAECQPKARAIMDWLVAHTEWIAADRMERIDLEMRRLRTERESADATEPTTTPEDTLREAGISSRRQARYQRRMSSLLAGRA